MADTPVYSFRFAPELIQRIDAYAVRLAAATGVRVSRNAAAQKLLTEALDAAEKPRGKGH